MPVTVHHLSLKTREQGLAQLGLGTKLIDLSYIELEQVC